MKYLVSDVEQTLEQKQFCEKTNTEFVGLPTKIDGHYHTPKVECLSTGNLHSLKVSFRHKKSGNKHSFI